jgi:hypothetical protein
MHSLVFTAAIGFLFLCVFSGDRTPALEGSSLSVKPTSVVEIEQEDPIIFGHSPTAYDPGGDCNDPGVGCEG